MTGYTVPLAELRMKDVESVGGKNASLGEMIGRLSGAGVRVPGGFATTAQAYRDFLAQDGLAERIAGELASLDVADVARLAEAGARIRGWILDTRFQPALESEVLAAANRLGNGGSAVAVRSSATAEDLPNASFAGQQESILNVRGPESVLAAMHQVYASLYNDRAISYRTHQGFDHAQVAISVGVQHMVRSDVGSSGVMFTLDTESGFREAVFITASWGLGELVVQGAVNPDEFYVYKPALRAGRHAVIRRNLGSKASRMVYAADPAPGRWTEVVEVAAADRARFCISDADVHELARQALVIESHYGCPMDIEWGKDGETGAIYVLQARPETVQSRVGRTIHRFSLKQRSRPLAQGRAIGQRIGAGPARVVSGAREMSRVQPGDVIVSDMTDPDWEPVMKRAAAIVTNRGGRTCHAAIIARELGIPAVVGCGDATTRIRDGDLVTVSCAEGDTGVIYDGRLDFEQQRIELDALPPSPVRIMMNVGNPDRAFDFASIPNHGVGLARLEFIINRMIGVHPRALLEFATLEPGVRDQVRRQMAGYDDPVGFFVEKLTEGIASIAAAFAPAAGDRAPVGLQVERVRQPDRRTAVRAARGEPDARVPRRLALHGSRLQALLRTRVPGAAPRARRNRTRQRPGDGALRSHGRARPGASSSCSRRTASSAAGTASS